MPLPITDVRDVSKLAYGFMASKALFSALNIELFGLISRGKNSAEEISAATGVPVFRVKTLVAALVSVGVLVQNNDLLENAPATETYLVPGAPAYFGDYYRFQIGGQIYELMNHLDAGLIGDDDGLAYQRMSGWLSDPARAEDFSRAQHAGSLGPAMMMAKRVDLSDATKLLDVAGGTGAYSIEFCKRNEALTATVLDFPTVTAVAERYVAQANMGDRISLLAGDARETDWPDDQDVVLMSYLLSAVDGSDIIPLFERSFSALRPGGQVIVHDFMLDEDRSGPSSAALFFLQYLAHQPDAISFTASDLYPLLEKTGFEVVSDEVMIPEITKMVSARKPI